MAVMIPIMPKDYEPQSMEGEMFSALEKLSDDYYVFHSFVIQNIDSNVLEQHEADFIVFNKQKGILCIEAKAGHVYYNQGWRYQTGALMSHDGPFRQADTNKWNLFHKAGECTAIKDFYKKCKFMSAVWFPSLKQEEINKMILPSEADRKLILTNEDLEDPTEKINAIFSIELLGCKETTLSKDEADKFLSEFLCPENNVVPATIQSLRLDSKRQVFYRLLKEQTMVLNFLEEQNTVAVNGAAGTGKTLIAVEKARRLAVQKEKVLFLCVNTELQKYLSKSYPNEYIDYTTFNAYVSKLAGSKNTFFLANDPRFEKAKETLEQIYLGEKTFEYKHIIVDEGQDFGDFNRSDFRNEILDLIKDIILEHTKGTFYIFYDKMQLIQATALPKCISDADCKITLWKNCRNTGNIAKASLKLFDKKSQNRNKLIEGCKDGDVPSMRFENNNIIEILNTTINSLLEKGYKTSDIIILSCKGFEESQLNKRKKISKESFYIYEKDKVKFSTSRKFKGMESDAIILVDVDKDTFKDDLNSQIYYVAASRAKLNLDVIVSMNEDDCRTLLERFDSGRIRNPKIDFARCMGCKFVE